MKIAFDAKRALNNSSGLGNYSRHLLNGLMKHYPNHEYSLFIPKARDEFFHQLHGDFKIHFPETKLQKSFHPLWRSFGVKNQILKVRADIFHGLSNEIPFGIQNSGPKTVVTIHDLIFLKHKEQYPFFERQIYQLKTRYAAKHADRIIAVSEQTKNDLMEVFGVKGEKIVVIPPIVAAAFQNQEPRSKSREVIQKYNLPSKYILNVGSFFPRKNHRTLIEALDLIKDKVSEDLLLVGNGGSERKAIEALIANKKLGQRVKIVSNIISADLPAINRAASVSVFPSLFEGFGMPIAEALFSKVPMIATLGGCFEEAGGKNCLYVNPKSAEEIAAAILKVLQDDALKNKMIENGFAHAQTMTEEVLSEKMMDVYKELAR